MGTGELQKAKDGDSRSHSHRTQSSPQRSPTRTTGAISYRLHAPTQAPLDMHTLTPSARPTVNDARRRRTQPHASHRVSREPACPPVSACRCTPRRRVGCPHSRAAPGQQMTQPHLVCFSSPATGASVERSDGGDQSGAQTVGCACVRPHDGRGRTWFLRLRAPYDEMHRHRPPHVYFQICEGTHPGQGGEATPPNLPTRHRHHGAASPWRANRSQRYRSPRQAPERRAAPATPGGVAQGRTPHL